MQRVIYLDRSREFWPTGWLVYFTAVLAIFDVSLIAFLVRQIVWHVS